MCDYYDDDDGNTSQTSDITFDSLMTDDNTIDEISLDSIDLYQKRRPSRKMMRAKKMEMDPIVEKEIFSRVVGIEVNEVSAHINLDDLKPISQFKKYYNILVEFYQVSQPQKLNNIKILLELFQDNETKLLQLIQKVEAEYDVSLIPPSHAISGNSYEVQKSSKKIQQKDENEIQSSTATIENSNPPPSFIEEDLYERICFQPKTKLKKRNTNKNNSVQKYKGNMKNLIDRLESVHQSAQLFLDKESYRYEKYLLDTEYHQKKTTNASK